MYGTERQCEIFNTLTGNKFKCIGLGGASLCTRGSTGKMFWNIITETNLVVLFIYNK